MFLQLVGRRNTSYIKILSRSTIWHSFATSATLRLGDSRQGEPLVKTIRSSSAKTTITKNHEALELEQFQIIHHGVTSRSAKEASLLTYTCIKTSSIRYSAEMSRRSS
ncbi:hypothetical protein J1614_003440 [Plenodomus biglobosus]|nr:hypothetical protein J1614_003440 [Plenodomus biglobosus]